MSSSHLSQIESGQRGVRPERAAGLAAALDIPVPEWVASYLETESRPATLLTLSRWLGEQDHLTSAHRVLGRIWTLNHRAYHNRYSFALMHQAASVAFKRQCWQTAHRWFARILRNPRHLDARTLGRMHYDVGLTLLMLKRSIEAYAAFQAALTQWGDPDAETRVWVGFAQLAMGNILLEHRGYRRGRMHYRAAGRLLQEPWRSEARFGLLICAWQESGEANWAALQEFGQTQTLSPPLHRRWSLVMAIAARQTEDYATAQHWLETLTGDSNPPDSWTAKLWVEWATLLASQRRWDEIPPVLTEFDALAAQADARDRLVMDLWRVYLLQEPVNPVAIRSAIREDYEERLPLVLGTLCNTLAPPHLS